MIRKSYVYSLGWIVCLIVVVSTVLLIVKEVELSWLIIIVAICCALWQLLKQCHIWWRGRLSKVAKRERLLRVLAGLMGLFLATGSSLYLRAFSYESTSASPDGSQYLFVNAEYLLRSIVCSLDLFMLDIDSNVLDQIKGHDLLKGMISIQAVLSFSCTVAVLLSLIYARVRAFRKLHWQTKIDDNHNHLYVFFGMNEASRLLANSIREKEGERGLIVIVEKSPVDDDDRGGWNSIVEMFAHREQYFADAEDLDARITFTETRLCEVDVDNLTKIDEADGVFDVLGEMNLMAFQKLIHKLYANAKNAELHMFVLSENEDDNIRAVSVLAQDKTINAGIGKVMQRLYCHARRNGLNRVIEDISVRQGLEVRIIDSANLAIELLKTDDRNHPARLVEIDNETPTTVKSAFHSLIIGFDEAGQDAFKYLYEFGSFVYSKSTPEKVSRSPFYCTIVDQRMQELNGYFQAFAPSVMEKTISENVSIKMLAYDCRSTDFYSLFDENFKNNLNYVVIALGSDELGMTCAIRLFNLIRQSREDLSRLRIFVRSYRSDKEDYMKKIADHYNEGYNTDYLKQLSEEDRESYIPQNIIVPFGQMKEIYSYRMIIDEELTLNGKRFQECYAKIKGEKELWDDRRNILLGVKQYVRDILGNKTIVEILLKERKTSLDNIRSLRRKEYQDMANALHAGTKLYLLKNSFGGDFDWLDFLDRYFEIDGKTPNCEGSRDTIVYRKLDEKENLAILNLARLEHLRWNASHEMLGYKKAEGDLHKCDERTRQHNCLRPWQELTKESIDASDDNWEADYKSFDFGVVDTSLLLYKDKLLD